VFGIEKEGEVILLLLLLPPLSCSALKRGGNVLLLLLLPPPPSCLALKRGGVAVAAAVVLGIEKGGDVLLLLLLLPPPPSCLALKRGTRLYGYGFSAGTNSRTRTPFELIDLDLSIDSLCLPMDL
jgi:hypothetical protein